MDDSQTRLEELSRLLRDLQLRVNQLEHKLESLSPPECKAPSKAASWSESSGQKPSATSPPPPSIVQGSSPSPNLESLIGSHWLNRVGIVAVLVGVSLFLRYAFESQWVGPAGRVLIGLLSGIGVIVLSEWFRLHSYPIFSFSLKALGLGTLYLSLWASFQVYEQISWVVAFISMIAVTASTIAMALWQEAEILALFALVGGFATPLLLYTHESRELPLFTYVALLNVATLILAASRPWSRLLLVGLLATVILYFAWYAIFYSPSELALTLAFATAFFAIFAIAPLLEGVYSSEEPNSHVLVFVASLNAGAYFFELYLMLERMDNTVAWCALALSAFYALLSRFPQARNEIDSARALRRLHLALCTIFITLAIAIRFESHWISMAWFAEAAALAAVGFWRRSAFVRWQALVLIAIAVAKVFAYDIWRLERGYRILGFFALGMLLLTVSFVYQRDWLRLSLERGDENSGSVQSK
jgi:uncharacterized membrane protein